MFARLALFIALCTAGTAVCAAPPSKTLTEEIIALSGITDQFDEVQRLAVGEIDNRKDAMTSKDYEQLRTKLGAQFDPAKMRADVVDVFMEHGDATKLQQWRNELQSPIMTRMRTLEQAASSDAAYQATIEFGRQLEQTPPSETRVTLVTQLAKSTAALDLALDSHLAVTRALLRHINPTLPENKLLDAKKENAILQDMRVQLAEQMNDVATVTYLYTYRDVSDADLRDYLGRYDSDLGRWATELTARAVRKALQSAVGSNPK